MNIKNIFLLLLGLHSSDTAFAQFYIGYDSLIRTTSYQHPPIRHTSVGTMELYQDSSSNQLLLISKLGKVTLMHLFHYQVPEDSITGEAYLLVKRDEAGIAQPKPGQQKIG